MPQRDDDQDKAISADVLLSRELRAAEGVEVARYRFRPVEVAVPALDEHAVTLHLNGPNRVVQWRDGRVREWTEGPGELAIHPPGAPMVVASLAVSDDLNVRLEGRLIGAVAAEAGADPALARLTPALGLRDPQIEHLLRAFLPELDAGGLGGELYTEALATALVVVLLRRQSALGAAGAALARAPAGRLADPALRRVTEYIEAHLDRSLGLAELATVAGLGPRHFTRLFRAATGQSPHQYVIRRRVERARLLLLTTDLPLAGVALASGFAHPSHLAAHFRRIVGVTPARYRGDG